MDASAHNTLVEVKPMNEEGISRGRGIFTRSAVASTQILCDIHDPLLRSLNTSRLKDTCYSCLKQSRTAISHHLEIGHDAITETTNLLLCKGCSTVRYCSRKCQIKSWTREHDLECKIFKRLYPKILPHIVRAAIQLVLRRKHDRIRQEDFDRFLQCLSHTDKLNDQDLYLSAQAVAAYSKIDTTLPDTYQLLCRLKINSLTLMNTWFEDIGLLMDPFLAMINHSCEPNAYLQCADGERSDSTAIIQIMPLQEKIAVGEEITLSYVDINNPYEIRQKELLERYFFVCRCARCISEQNDLTTRALLADSRGKADMEASAFTQASAFFSQADQASTLRQTREYLLNAAGILYRFHESHTLRSPLAKTHPFAQTIQKLTITHIDLHSFAAATCFAALQFLTIDPAVYIPAYHPTAMVHAYLLIRLLTLLVDEGRMRRHGKSAKTVALENDEKTTSFETSLRQIDEIDLIKAREEVLRYLDHNRRKTNLLCMEELFERGKILDEFEVHLSTGEDGKGDDDDDDDDDDKQRGHKILRRLSDLACKQLE